VNGLERELRALQDAFPPTPDLAPGVRNRIGGARPSRLRRRLVLAAAVLAVVVAAVLAASPDARSTIRDWLGIGGAEVVRVNELPEVDPQLDPPAFGAPVTRDEADAATSFPLRFPEELGEPDALYSREEAPGGMVIAVYGEAPHYRAVYVQWVGESAEPSFYKVAAGGTPVERVGVNGGRGLWLSGSPHLVYWFGTDGDDHPDQVFLAGNVLLWEDGPLSYRIEADVSKEQALELARSLR
jgi:hypothetical protein